MEHATEIVQCSPETWMPSLQTLLPSLQQYNAYKYAVNVQTENWWSSVNATCSVMSCQSIWTYFTAIKHYQRTVVIVIDKFRHLSHLKLTKIESLHYSLNYVNVIIEAAMLETSGEGQPNSEGEVSHCSNRGGPCVCSIKRIAKKRKILTFDRCFLTYPHGAVFASSKKSKVVPVRN
jgi:hypothetical protein